MAISNQQAMRVQRPSVLVADYDPYMLRLMARNLAPDGYQVHPASDEQEIVEQVMTEAPELLILDIAVPKFNGPNVCGRVRELSTVPMIIVTAIAQDDYKIACLEAGADDYITKPFHPGELQARIHAVLRRSKQRTETCQEYFSKKSIGSLTIDFDQCLATVDGFPVKLTATEFRILAFLAQHAGRVLTPDLLLEHIWSWNYVGERNLLKVNISRLRRKIEPDPAHPIFIVTKNGIGYLMPIQPSKGNGPLRSDPATLVPAARDR
ncbi:MAG: response regulator transcription factor [Ktedonobacterales bacterium]